jgi:hypothetical protein
MGFRVYRNESIRLRSRPRIVGAIYCIRRSFSEKVAQPREQAIFTLVLYTIHISCYYPQHIGIHLLDIRPWRHMLCSCKALWKPFKKGTSFRSSSTCLKTLPTSGPLLTIRTPNSTMKGSKSRFCARNAACCSSGDAMMYIFDVNIGSV